MTLNLSWTLLGFSQAYTERCNEKFPQNTALLCSLCHFVLCPLHLLRLSDPLSCRTSPAWSSSATEWTPGPATGLAVPHTRLSTQLSTVQPSELTEGADSSHGAGGVTEGANRDLWRRGKEGDRKPTLTMCHLCVSHMVNARYLHPQGDLCVVLVDR